MGLILFENPIVVAFECHLELLLFIFSFTNVAYGNLERGELEIIAITNSWNLVDKSLNCDHLGVQPIFMFWFLFDCELTCPFKKDKEKEKEK